MPKHHLSSWPALLVLGVLAAPVAARPSPSVTRGEQGRLERVRVTIEAADLKRPGSTASSTALDAASRLGCPSDAAMPLLSAKLGVDEAAVLIPARGGSSSARTKLARWEDQLRADLARGGKAEVTVELRYQREWLPARPDALKLSYRLGSASPSTTIDLEPCVIPTGLTSILSSRAIAASRATMAWIAVGSGFSCTIEPKSGLTICLPGESNAYFVTGQRPDGRVAQFGGHDVGRQTMTRLLGKSAGDPIESTYRGGHFVVEAPGRIKIGTNSRTLNPDREMEASIRSKFRAQILEMTGLRE